MRFGSILKVGISLGVLLLALSVCYAQTTRGIIAGTVTDSTGAVVTGATVNVERMEGGDKHTTTTGPNGEYRIEALTPGSYKVTASSPNFSTVEVTGVLVSASIITPVNVKLDVGKASTTITVESTGQAVQTETGQLEGVIPSTQIKDLPIASGNPYSLATTLPGVTTPDSRDDFANGPSFIVDGLRPRGNNFLIDGFDNNDYGITGQALQPTNQEAVQEVTVLKNSYTAEYGRGGSSVSNLTFKSGTNTFHGSGWWQYSGSSLNAVKFEEALNGETRPPHQVNNLYGFTLGGPIVKDKLFFFVTPQWTRNYGAQPAATLELPTEAGVATLQSLLPNPQVQLLLDTVGTLRGSTGSGVSDIPIGDRPGCVNCQVQTGLFTRTDVGVGTSHEWTVRGDYLPTSSDTIYARYTDTHTDLTPDLFANSTALPSQDTLQSGPARNFGVLWAHTFGPRAINEFRFSGQQIAFSFAPMAATELNPIAHQPGFAFGQSFTNVSFGGFEQATFPQGRSHKTFQAQDAVSITHGAHAIKFGADVAVILANDQIPFNADGLITFYGDKAPADPANPNDPLDPNHLNCYVNGAVPGTDPANMRCTDLANFIDGFSGGASPAANNITKSFGSPLVSVPTDQQGYYIQDTWKVLPNLTLDLGVRYEYQPPDASNVLDFPAINRKTFFSDAYNLRVPVKPDRNNFGPRFGFSYAPKFWSGILGENKTVIRGGAGIFYDTFFTNISDNTASSSPNAIGRSTGLTSGRGLANAFGVLAALTPTVSQFSTRTSVVSDLRNPMTYQWNLNVQRDLPAHLIAEVAYVGTRATGLFVNEQLNPVDFFGPRIHPTRGSTVVRGNSGDSIYHGLQTQLSRTFGHMSMRAAYTYSKVIDNGSEVFATTGGASRWQNTQDPRSDRGVSAFDRTHRFTLAWVYELPSVGHGVLNRVLGGWSTTGNVVYQSGAPETLYFGGLDQNGDGEGFNDRPHSGNPNAPLDVTFACANTPGCISGVGIDFGGGNLFDLEHLLFDQDPAGSFTPGTADQFRYMFDNNLGLPGDIGRNSIRLPAQQTWNLGVIKRIQVYERSNLEFRVDFFNAFNHSNAGVRNLVGYGDLTNVDGFLNPFLTRGGGRSIQTWVKFTF